MFTSGERAWHALQTIRFSFEGTRINKSNLVEVGYPATAYNREGIKEIFVY